MRQYWWLSCQLWTCSCLSDNLGSCHPENLSKSRQVWREVSMAELWHSETSVREIHSDFTYDSEIYDIVKLYSDLGNFICFLIQVSCQFKLYINVINLVNVNHLIYYILIGLTILGLTFPLPLARALAFGTRFRPPARFTFSTARGPNYFFADPIYRNYLSTVPDYQNYHFTSLLVG